MGLRAAVFAIFGLSAAPALAAEPVSIERFDGERAALLTRWSISAGLDPAARGARVTPQRDVDGAPFLRVRVEPGDALDPPGGETVCDANGSRAAELAAAGTTAANERVELQMRADRATGAGELVRFGATVWYAFAFRIPPDNPRDTPPPGREPCRTVIHQVKQDAVRDGKSCGASPFFKLEARPAGAGVAFFGQATSGSACAGGAHVARARFCETALPLGAWVQVAVRLTPSAGPDGAIDVWLDGRACGRYRGPLGDPVDGMRRAGAPFVNVQPRFGIYRDRRLDAQQIDFRDIAFWTDDPAGDGAWPAPR